MRGSDIKLIYLHIHIVYDFLFLFGSCNCVTFRIICFIYLHFNSIVCALSVKFAASTLSM